MQLSKKDQEKIQEKSNEKFQEYFKEVYQGQWEQVQDRLNHQNKHYINLFSTINEDTKPLPFNDTEEGYFIDDGSFLLMKDLALHLKENYCNINELRGLDLCSAPGGKAMALIKLFEKYNKKLFLDLNEKSSIRFFRLQKNLKQFLSLLPHASLENVDVKTMRMDGRFIGKKEQDVYDFSYIDAPCSSIAHRLEKSTKTWSKKESKRLSKIQYALLMSALNATKAKGLIAYSTCTIDPLENEMVVSKFINKNDVSLLSSKLSFQSDLKKEVGQLILNESSGPLYYAIFKKM